MSWINKLFSAISGKEPEPVRDQPPSSAARPSAPTKRAEAVIKPGQYIFHNADIVALDDGLTADIRIELVGCKQLKSLPANLKTGTLDLTGCSALENLPSGIEVAFLDLADCSNLRSLPDDLKLRGGRLNLRNCSKLDRLPNNIGEVAQLDLSGCALITTVPDGLNVTSWIDIGRSGIQKLPKSLSHVSVRRDGEPVTANQAFET